MAEVQLSTVVDLDLVKMKWREQYVSEGLNRKVVPGQPPGIYQGLRVIENTSNPRQVELAPDPDTGYHMAVYQSTTGFSLTYWDQDGTSIILDLSDANLSNQETVIGLEMDYQIGVDTTANWMAFPIADWNALPASRKDEIVVLGTVQVPLSTLANITSADISFERRTYAWRSLSKGTIPWSPVLRNGDFEMGGEGTAFSQLWYWELSSTPNTGSGSVTSSDLDPDRHQKHLRVTSVTSGEFTFSAVQNVYVPVVPGQLVMVKGRKKQILAPSSGTIDLTLSFTEKLGGLGSTVSVNIDQGTTDGSYEDFLEIFEVPALTTGILRDVSIGGTVTYGSAPAELIYIDDVQVYLETSGERSDLQRDYSGDRVVNGRMTIREPGSTWATDGVVMDHDSGNNELDVALYDPDPSLFKIDVDGSVIAQNQLSAGDSLLSAVSDAEVARVTATPSTFAGVEYTLLWESVASGNRGLRLYVGPNGRVVETVNAIWDNTLDQWTKDNNGAEAFRRWMGIIEAKIEHQVAGTNTWNDSSWLPVFLGDATGIGGSTLSASGVLTATTLQGQLDELRDGKHGVKTKWLTIGNASMVDLNDNLGYSNVTGNGVGTVQSSTVGGTRHMSFDLGLVVGDRLLTLETYAFVGNGAGEELQAEIFRQNSSGSNTQVSTTKTSGAVGGLTSVGWTTADTDFTPNGHTLLDEAYAMVVRMPQTSGGGEFLWLSARLTYDHP